ncbi:L-lactate utilization operon repressor [Leminorella richardii]|uniref:L-lactate utilization operon repressor n=1 Tax=Leminorella richardii TaxID=158841 RepID=A0A2X4ULF1_9GAMM|nr:FCD domain-containing protein [Leminorella richardii]SQI36388.1 L-lactate utilization operon repressor [Leminorella richardii]
MTDKRLYKEIATAIKQQLSDGVYKVGDKLPTERTLSETFGVGRAVIREAMILLEAEGFIDIRKSSGVYVLKNETVINSFLDGKAGPFELLQARQLIETSITAFAATQIVKSDLAKLYEILEQEKKLLDSPPDQSLDAQFHCAIAASTQNAMLAEIVRYIWDVRNRDPLWQTLTKESDQEEYSRKGFAEHEEIVAALQRKDPIAARQSMWQHLENIKLRVTKQLEYNEQPTFDRFLFESIPLELPKGKS